MWLHAAIGEYNCGSFLPCDGDVTPGPPPTCTQETGTKLTNCQNDEVCCPSFGETSASGERLQYQNIP